MIAARYFLDLSEAEMADVLDCPRGTVKSRLSRAIGRLREVDSSSTRRNVEEAGSFPRWREGREGGHNG